ncbi:TPA: glucosyl transferase [Escherichia coli]|nr:glucosyl transferase [Escherichia coli]
MVVYRKQFLLLFVILATAGIIITRRPDIIANAVPWAEDGAVWLSQAHNIGISSIFMPQDGYMQTISRISYIAGVFFGIDNAPLVATVIAIALRCLMCAFFISERFNFISVRLRFLLVIYFMLMPNIEEGFVNITNAQWYLSLYAIGVLIANAPSSKSWKTHDVIILLISGLSGPFVLFLAPCLFFKYAIPSLKLRSFKNLINYEVLIIAFCFIVQASALLAGFDNRSKAPLGASITLLADIFAMRMLFGSFFDTSLTTFVVESHIINISSLIIYLVIIACLFYKGDWKTKSLISFGVLMMASSLYRPMMTLESEQWPAFLLPGAGERYFFITNFLFICSIVYSLNTFCKLNDKSIIIIISLLCLPVSYTFRMNDIDAPDYKQEILKYNSAAKGDTVSIKIAPRGWDMKLIKK